MTDAPVLAIRDLRVTYRDRSRTVVAADGIDLALAAGRTLALVGESGCGKTTVALSVLGLLPKNAAVESGRVVFDGRDLLALPPRELQRVRGRQISMIFQDPVAGLNPVLTIGAQVEEIVRAHRDLPRKESLAMTREALRAQGLADVDRLMGSYPFQLSGGMCQRVMIAIATVLRPAVIIADEPTASLDVTVQAGILHELDALKREMAVAILLISHDLGVVAQMADDVAVMYAGRIVERADVARLYANPAHPYTAALLAAWPRPDADFGALPAIKGHPPDLGALTGECAFLPRCGKALTRCRTEAWPALAPLAEGREAACYNPMFLVEA